MRKPDTIETLHLDFDGFFASVEQQARPALRGKPVGIVPFDGTKHTVVIACSREAKARGVSNIMRVDEALKICPDLVLQCQSPDLYRRAHNALLAEIRSVIPIEAIKSIDELCCRLSPSDIADPEGLTHRIKTAIRDGVGAHITCSIGYGANRQLAKIACKVDKPDGMTVWHPAQMPGPLLKLPLSDIPGIGKSMEKRLNATGIMDMAHLLATRPKQLRKIWHNVTGERLWYALHGYDVKAQKSDRRMFGHGRVLPPNMYTLKDARDCSRVLLVKAARRMRREGYYAGSLHLWVGLRDRFEKQPGWRARHTLPQSRDDRSVLHGLDALWTQARAQIPNHLKIVQLSVGLGSLSHGMQRQGDMFVDAAPHRQKWERVTQAVDSLNMRYGKSLVTMGPWKLPPGGNLGGKISFTRIPRAEDFW